jgi:thioredoxin 1
MKGTIAVNAANFEAEVLQAALPVLVKFGASWCGQCAIVDALLKQTFGEFEGRVKLCEVDADREAELRERHRVISLPALFLYKNRVIVEKAVGIFSKSNVLKLLNLAVQE